MVRIGGPVMTNHMHVLQSANAYGSSREIIPGLFYGGRAGEPSENLSVL
jgi:hypothetical protein